MQFHRRQFLSFSEKQQHKKCAEILRKMYQKQCKHHSIEEDLALYNTIQEWLEKAPLPGATFDEISDRYHTHLRAGKIHLREHDLLPNVQTKDRTEPLSLPLPVSVYLDNLRSAHNVGSILRTVEGLGLGTVYLAGHTPPPSHNQVEKAAMGTTSWIDCVENATFEELPRPIIALETSDEATPLNGFTFPDSFTLAVGNEEYGCSPALLFETDILIQIPMRGRKNSLNVANAFAITAWTLADQLQSRKKEFSHAYTCSVS